MHPAARARDRGTLAQFEGTRAKAGRSDRDFLRPANGDAKALHLFEKEIAKILGAALLDAGALR